MNTYNEQVLGKFLNFHKFNKKKWIECKILHFEMNVNIIFLCCKSVKSEMKNDAKILNKILVKWCAKNTNVKEKWYQYENKLNY